MQLSSSPHSLCMRRANRETQGMQINTSTERNVYHSLYYSLVYKVFCLYNSIQALKYDGKCRKTQQTCLTDLSISFLNITRKKRKKNCTGKCLQKEKRIPPKPNRINPTTACRKIMALTYTTQSCFLSWECLMSLLLKAWSCLTKPSDESEDQWPINSYIIVYLIPFFRFIWLC